MVTDNEIKNKVAESGIVTLNLEDFYTGGERLVFDLKPLLFEELVLKEKDFRQFIKDHDWSAYAGKHIAVTCTADAIIPMWAYMLVSSSLTPYAATIVVGDLEQLETRLFMNALSGVNTDAFRDKRVVIKGCGDISIPVSAYTEISRMLRPVVKSLMYGEPCSTVPVYKKN